MIFVSPPEDFPIFTVWILFVYMITMLTLFGNFFVKTYTQGAKNKAAKVAAGGVEGKKKQ